MLDERVRAVLAALAGGTVLYSDPAPRLEPPGPTCGWREWISLLASHAVERRDGGGWQISAAGRELLAGEHQQQQQ